MTRPRSAAFQKRHPSTWRLCSRLRGGSDDGHSLSNSERETATASSAVLYRMHHDDIRNRGVRRGKILARNVPRALFKLSMPARRFAVRSPMMPALRFSQGEGRVVGVSRHQYCGFLTRGIGHRINAGASTVGHIMPCRLPGPMQHGACAHAFANVKVVCMCAGAV